MKLQVSHSASTIADRVSWLGTAIRQDYERRPLTIVSVLRGAFIFTADLVRSINRADLYVDFVGVESYLDGTESNGTPKLTQDLTTSVRGRHVLIVEDIVDSGFTVQFLREHLRRREAESIAVCTLLNKPTRRRVETKLEYVGFEIDDKFIVGYGLDSGQSYRSLPYLAIADLR